MSHIEVRNILDKPRTRNGVVRQPQPLYNNTVYNADIVPGKSIRLHGIHQGTPFDVSFNLGDVAEYDSYNLKYVSPITKITANTVTICERDRTNHRLSLYEFSWRNYDFNLDKVNQHNEIESQCI